MILLDTHVLIWLAGEPNKLSKKAIEAIREARTSSGLVIASITLFELAWMAEHRRVQVAQSVESFVRELASKVAVRAITPEIAAHAVRLPRTFPSDPQDRIIAATSVVEGMPLVTADRRLRESNLLDTIW